MRTIQVNPETRPELFNLGRDLLDEDDKPVAEVDPVTGLATENIVQVYDVKTIVDKEAFVDYDLIKRKSAKGIAEFRAYNDNAYIYHEIDGVHYKLAHQEVFLEYLDPKLKDKWVRVKADLSVDSTALTKDGDVVKAELNSDTGKQTFTVAKKGFTVRCAWVITRFNEYDGAVDDLKIDFSDYDGNIDDSDWVEDVRTIVFESKGVADVLVVDPYISVVTTSTTITVEFDSGDSVVWTIADENAILKENPPVRAVIHEDYFEWTVYDEYMVRWQHDTAASTTGAAFSGNSYCTDANKTQIGSYNYYFYPATSANNTAKTTLAAELADISTGITTGTAVTDRHWPGKIASGTSGACYDGAFHLTSDSNNAGKLTIDRDRALPAVVIEDWPIMTGDPSAPDEYLTESWDCSQGTTNTGGKTVAISGASYVEGVKGNGIEILGTDTVRFPFDGDTLDVNTGTIEFDYKGTPDAHNFLFMVTSDAGEHLWLRFGSSSYMQIGGMGAESNRTVFPWANLDNNTFYHFKFVYSFSGGNCNYKLSIGAESDSFSFAMTQLAATTNPLISVGCHSSASTVACEGIIDNFKIYSAPILPYGSFIPGDIIHSEEYDRAHSDITFFWDCESTAIQIHNLPDSGTVITNGTTFEPGIDGNGVEFNASTDFVECDCSNGYNIDVNQGTISFYYKQSGTCANWAAFLALTDNTTHGNWHIQRYSSDDNKLAWNMRNDGVPGVYNFTHSSSFLDGNWHFFALSWDLNSTGELANGIITIDGVKLTRVQQAGYFNENTGLNGTLRLGRAVSEAISIGGVMDNITITSSPSTPAVSTINGKPILLPHIKSEVS